MRLIQDTHAGGLAGHFRRDKIISQLESRFFWPSLKKETAKFIQRCPVCQEAKGVRQTLVYICHCQCPLNLGQIYL